MGRQIPAFAAAAEPDAREWGRLLQWLEQLRQQVNETRVDLLSEIAAAIVQGDGTKLQSVTTPGAAGELAQWDSGGKLADSGVTAADVTEGPASAADNSVPTFDATTGKLLQDQGNVFIDDSGRLGVGTSAPASALHVEGGDIRNQRAAGETAQLSLAGNGHSYGSGDFVLQQDASFAYVWQRQNSALLFGTNATERLRIDAVGALKQSTASGTLRYDLGTCQIHEGSGSPEGVVSAPVGSTYHRTDGGLLTSLYVKESGGSGNTGWVGK